MNEPPLRIADVMTASPISIDIGRPLSDAQKIMTEKGIRHLPVTENGKPASMLSERDIHLAAAAHKGLNATDELTVGEVCTLQTYMVSPETSLAEVVSHMGENQIGSVIVAKDDQLAGIFTATDACRQLANLLR